MSKTEDEFLDHFARLGVFSKVQFLMGSETEPTVNTVAVLETNVQEIVDAPAAPILQSAAAVAVTVAVPSTTVSKGNQPYLFIISILGVWEFCICIAEVASLPRLVSFYSTYN